MSIEPLSLVIDADIARSSGETEHPISSGSRRLLEAVSISGHKLALCPTLRAEWRKHQSRFAIKWLASMYARKKISSINPQPEIATHILENIPDGKEKKIALKDCHLLDAAFNTGKIIASNDATARSAFCNIATSKKEICTISWFNALDDLDTFTNKALTGKIIPKKFYLSEPS
ncbi:hypothetical protein WCE02_20235 [Pseudomonas juntendi]|uniref:hypothetical protein n=1 Tax=Pseudomonas juntendi TaxID=2666183 RepID=UPI0034D59860